MIRIFKRLPGVIFMVLLLGLAGKEALSHQRTYSPVEKRELQTRPEISITKVLDGRFQKKYESYLRDQFPGRDHWVSFQTDMELFMGKNEIHNVYIGKNHYLLEHYTEKEFDPQQISKNLQALEKFVGKAKQNADVHVMMVPTKSWVLREKLPAFAPHYKEQKFYDALQQKLEKEDVLISVEPVLDAHKEEDSAAIAEVPMISANADTLVIVKAKNAASKKKIRSALKKYREELIQDTCQYPMNQLKIQASKVYVKGNYVCFIMLGTISNKQEEQSEDKVIAAYKKQNEKAVKAISKLYK